MLKEEQSCSEFQIVYLGINEDFVLEEETEFLKEQSSKALTYDIFDQSHDLAHAYQNSLSKIDPSKNIVIQMNCKAFSRDEFPGQK